MTFVYSKTASVPYEESKRRAIEYLRAHATTRPAHMIACAIWPEHKMKSQGAGGAASRILRLMAKENLVRWTCETTAMGHRLSGGWKLR